jgi:hypothetical protein
MSAWFGTAPRKGIASMSDWYQTAVVEAGRAPALWLLIGFVLTYGVTRWVTLRIHARRQSGADDGNSRIRDLHIGGVHVHHQVWGILLVLLTGLLEFRFRPDSPWVEVLAALFGAGAALALDEFALWLHLEDVYWSEQGRKSIDAVMLAAVVGLVLLVGTSPIGVDEETVATTGVWGTAVAIVVHIGYTIICLLKGKIATGLIGLPVPLVSLVGAVRLAQPSSFWARRFYAERKMATAVTRHHRTLQQRDRLRDVFSGAR